MFHNSVGGACRLERTQPDPVPEDASGERLYFGMEGFEYPMGNIQMVGKSQASMYKGEKSIETKLADVCASRVAHHAVDFGLSTEDLPDPTTASPSTRRGRSP
jgi:hypothetical protein